MTVELKLRLTSHMLGALPPNKEGVRKLQRDINGLICLDGPLWRLNLEIARHNLQLKCNVKEGVVAPERLLPPRTYLFRRVYGAGRAELFEICRTGCVLTMPFEIKEISQAPTETQLKEILSYVGINLGLPSWGNKFGLGRFILFQPRTPTEPG